MPLALYSVRKLAPHHSHLHSSSFPLSLPQLPRCFSAVFSLLTLICLGFIISRALFSSRAPVFLPLNRFISNNRSRKFLRSRPPSLPLINHEEASPDLPSLSISPAIPVVMTSSVSLTNMPAAAPPPGVKSNFVNPPSLAPTITVLDGIFISLMLVAVAVRVFVRVRGTKAWGWDDCKSMSIDLQLRPRADC